MSTESTQYHLTAGPNPGEISTLSHNIFNGAPGNYKLTRHVLQTGVTTHTALTMPTIEGTAAIAWNSFDSQMVIISQATVASVFNIGTIDLVTGVVTDITTTASTTTSKIKAAIAPASGTILTLHQDGTFVFWDAGDASWENTWSGTLNFTGDQVPILGVNSQIRTLAINPTDGKIYCVLDSSGNGTLQAVASFDWSDVSSAANWDIDMAEHLLLDHTQALVWV